MTDSHRIQPEWINDTKEWMVSHFKARRRLYNIPQREYAELLHISLEKYRLLEQEPTKFSMDYLLYIATWLGFEPEITLHTLDESDVR